MTGKAYEMLGGFCAEPSANGMGGVIVDGQYYAAMEFAELHALGPARDAMKRLAEIARASGKQE